MTHTDGTGQSPTPIPAIWDRSRVHFDRAFGDTGGIAALVVSQSTYEAGPLAYSMPFVGVLEPVVAGVVGNALLGEQIQISGAVLLIELLAAAIACGGILLLTTSQTVLSVYQEQQPLRSEFGRTG